MLDLTHQRTPPHLLYRSGHLWRKWRNEHPAKNTESIPLKDIRRRTEDLQNDIPDLPTVLISKVPVSPRDMPTSEVVAQVLSPSLRVQREVLPPPLSIDQEGRVCLRIVDVGIATTDLVEQGIQQFGQLTGEYPAEIVPCPSRLYGLRDRYWYYLPNGQPIPCVADYSLRVGYDIVLRGRRS